MLALGEGLRKKMVYPRKGLPWASKSVHTQLSICLTLSIVLSLTHLFSLCLCCLRAFFFSPFSHSIAVPLALSYLSQVCLLHLMMYCQKGGWKKNKTSFFREERQNAMQEGNCTQGLQMQFSSINAVRANSFVNVFRS